MTPIDTTTVRFTVDGEPAEGPRGASVAAALLAAGRRSWRRTRIGGEPRGVFCGIGICFDCLVTVNGSPNRRACLTPVADGDAVTTQDGAGRDHLAC